MINFWKEEKGVVISRRTSFEIKVDKKQKAEPSQKMQLNSSVQKALAKAKVESCIVNGVASIVAKNFDVKKRKQVVYLAILSAYGREKGLRAYNLIKHLL